MEGCGLVRCCSFAANADMKAGGKEERRLKEEIRKSCSPKTGQRLLEKKQNIRGLEL
jgi:uncharacterized membrane protein YebE (DUF533 family)